MLGFRSGIFLKETMKVLFEMKTHHFIFAHEQTELLQCAWDPGA